jgi:hypothetical protein
VHAQLQKTVDTWCKARAGTTTCGPNECCSVVSAKIQNAKECLAARRSITQECYLGNQNGHEEAEADALAAYDSCRGIFDRGECRSGC